jgi:formylglycine-generating enzyme required for sulfatase activity/predicted MPP superfamily phosphohydrolase
MALTWLHVSDFHLSNGAPYDQVVILRALVESVRRFREEGHVPDLIFATGDIAQNGKANEYDAATKFFDDLLEAAALNRDRLFIIPGNHDVDRKMGKWSHRHLDNAEEADEYFDPESTFPQLRDKFQAFSSWYNDYFKAIRSFPTNTTCSPVELVTINGLRLAVLPLNSALFCIDDHDHEKLFIGCRCLDAARKQFEAADLKVALIHHPLDWLSPFEQSNIEAVLEESVDLLLQGHFHQVAVKGIVSANGGYLKLAAGASYQTRQWPNTAMYVTFENSGVTIFPIRYEDKPGEKWTLDTSLYPSPSYTGSFVLPRRLGTGYDKDLLSKLSAPKAFIAYSWEDDNHKKWVADLATRLRHSGVETILDQWHAVPGDQLPDFMEKEIRNNDYVLIICTPKYRSKCDKRDGGAGYEGDIMTAEVFTTKNHRKFIPVLAKGSWDESAPSWLKGKFYVDLSTPVEDERDYPRLLAALLNSHPQPPPVMQRMPEIPFRLLSTTLPIVKVENRQQLFRNTNEQNAEYILIPGGSYLYSATEKEEQVSDIYFAKYPVTNQRYRDFIQFLQSDGSSQGVSVSVSSIREELKAIAKRNLWWPQLGDYLYEGKNDLAALFRSSFDGEAKFKGNNQPVVGVTWYAARAYCLWLSMLEGSTMRYRLPTEIEWEWAAGGIRQTTPQKVRDYPWPEEEGDISVRLANYNSTVGATTPVGSYPDGATPEGLYDMAGNVWEWTDSWWEEKKLSLRVLRGGCWRYDAEYCRSAYRGSCAPGYRGSYVGFRPVFVP